MITDPIADMLTRIRNANKTSITKVSMPSSNEKKAIANILAKEGYISSYKIEGDKVKTLTVNLKFSSKGEKVISDLKRISKPGLRVYASVDELPKVLNGLGLAIISTSKGYMTDKEAREQRLGGEVIAYIW